MIRIADLDIPLEYNQHDLKEATANKLGVDISCVGNVEIVRRSVDNSNREDVHFIMTLLAGITGDEGETEIVHRRTDKSVTKDVPFIYILTPRRWTSRPVIVGCGPAGLFAALILARAGARPIVLERGHDIDRRRESVRRFWQTGELDVDSNVQFGEGGAGAFSDGKLKTGKIDARKMMILKEFVEAGAPPEIMYLAKPHIGTDRLGIAVKGIREKIISLGGEIRFGARMTDILIRDDAVAGIGYDENGIHNEVAAEQVVLAIGNSARDTFGRLLDSGIRMESRPIAVGLRIEHPRELIDRLQYGRFAGHPALGAADYKMVVHLPNGRGVYTFCMCPGGSVIAAASEEGTLVTNVMSLFSRDGMNSNSAILVTVDAAEQQTGMDFLRMVEAKAFSAGGGGYKAPVQRLDDFMHRRNSVSFGEVLPTYRPGTGFAPVESYLSDAIADSLRQAIIEMGEWMPGFYLPDALLTGPETRSSSPVRILRGGDLQADGTAGLYPCGEGAGYSGGIVSAAVDGVLCAEQIISRHDGVSC
ncbi:MAG: NAD(P)/FAD-dependent oxidoreductase [Saccharofermentanales bacterium]